MIFYLNKVEQGFKKGGGGHGNQVLFAKDGNTNNNLEHTELDFTASSHQLKQLLGDERSPEGSEAGGGLPYKARSQYFRSKAKGFLLPRAIAMLVTSVATASSPARRFNAGPTRSLLTFNQQNVIAFSANGSVTS